MKITLRDKTKKYIHILCQNNILNYHAITEKQAQTMGTSVSPFRAVSYSQTH